MGTSIGNSNAFVPASLLEDTTMTIDKILGGDFGEVSESFTHEEIIREGIIQSAVRYFYDQPGGSSKVNLSKIDNEYHTLTKLYFDFYGRSVCYPELDDLLKKTFQLNVAKVDFEDSTKRLPYAHFDAEKFNESNACVKDMTSQIDSAINSGDYDTARKLAGQVMHTIQDFYSHSNHVEMGLTTINELIGTDNFTTLPIISESETNTPVNKPTDKVKCSHGGVLDESSSVSAVGGINKDSGYLVFSPHASLHVIAAKFFNLIRDRVGDERFNNFLDLTVSEVTLSALPTSYTCRSSRFAINGGLLLLALFFIFLIQQ